jgi:hypothetical protein
LHPWDKRDFIPTRLNLALGRAPRRSPESEAVVTWHIMIGDLEDLLLRLCEPDASGRVPTGACTNAWTWTAPVQMCATYNRDAKDIARDLALSWLHLHDQAQVARIAGLSLEALHARVDAAPRDARVEVYDTVSLSLSRETVLKAMAAPPALLLDALEAAAAVPDDAWRAAEPRAQEILDLTAQLDKQTGEGPPEWAVDVSTRAHVRFLEEHAPFRVRRLPSGGVVLATHPYRSLWPLWADALLALDLLS